MIYLILLLVASFLLEGLYSTVIAMNSYFIPLFTLISLVMIYPYFSKYDSSYWFFCIGIGFGYDLIYTNTLLIHAVLFFILGYFVSFLYQMLSRKWWNDCLVIMASIVFYRVLSFLLLVTIGYISFSYEKILVSIICSIFINVIYAGILYGILLLLKRFKKVHLY